MYVDDFGEIVLIPHPYGLTRDCVFVDPKMLSVASLRGVQTRELAKTGDNTRFLMTAEACLVVRNERSAAVIADLT